MPFVSSAARLDRDRDGLLVFFVGVVLLRAAAFFYLFAEVFVPARGVPVLLLASWTAVARLAAAALLGSVRQRGGAGGAVCEEHFGLTVRLFTRRAPEGQSRLPDFLVSLSTLVFMG